MGLLRPKNERKTKETLPEYRFLTCPMNGHQVCFCRGLCEPVNNRGMCGRYVPQDLTGRTQAAIAGFKANKVGRTPGHYHSRAMP